MYYFPAERVAWIVAVLSVLLSSVLLIGAIVTLYNITSSSQRLGVAGGFTVLFAASIGLLTNARRSEVFGITAALVFPFSAYPFRYSHHCCCRYAAVLVVYLSAPQPK